MSRDEQVAEALAFVRQAYPEAKCIRDGSLVAMLGPLIDINIEFTERMQEECERAFAKERNVWGSVN